MERAKYIVLGAFLSTFFIAEVAQARIFRRVFNRDCQGMSCGVRNNNFRNNNFNGVNNGGGACRQLLQVQESADLQVCVDSRGNRSIVQKLGSDFSSISEGNVEEFRDPNVTNPLIQDRTFFRRIFVRRDGTLIDRRGNPIENYRDGNKVVSGLRSHYRENLGNFRRGSQGERVANRFLNNNGGFNSSNGEFEIDLTSLPLSDKLMQELDIPREVAGVRALNYLLNTVNTGCQVRFSDADGATGKVRLSFFGRGGSHDGLNLASCLGTDAMNLFEEADPLSSCSISGVPTIRLGHLINKLMLPKNYYKLLGAPRAGDIVNGRRQANDRDAFLNTVGIPRDPQNASNLFYIGANQSGVVADSNRELNVEIKRSGAAPGKPCFRSFDFKASGTADSSGAASEARDPKINGDRANFDAEEILCVGSNGFMQGYIFDAQKKLILDEAPASVAHGGPIAKGTVVPVMSCLHCHATGYNGGEVAVQGPHLGKRYTDFSNDLRGKGRFISPTEYGSFAKSASTQHVQNLRNFNAFIRDPAPNKFIAQGNSAMVEQPFPILPRIAAEFTNPIEEKDFARDSGLAGISSAGLIKTDGKIDRTVADNAVRSACESRFRGVNNLNRDQLGERRNFENQFRDLRNHEGQSRRCGPNGCPN